MMNRIDMSGYTERAFSWENLVQAVTGSAGARWFAQYPEATIQDLRSVFPPVSQLADAIPFADEWVVRAPFGAMLADGNTWELPAETLRFVP